MIRYDFKEEGGAEKWRNRMHSRRHFCAPWTPPSRRLGKLALSAEALAVSAKFNACFTDDEVNHCFAQLCAANYFGKARF